MAFLWSFVAKYRCYWTCIVFLAVIDPNSFGLVSKKIIDVKSFDQNNRVVFLCCQSNGFRSIKEHSFNGAIRILFV